MSRKIHAVWRPCGRDTVSKRFTLEAIDGPVAGGQRQQRRLAGRKSAVTHVSGKTDADYTAWLKRAPPANAHRTWRYVHIRMDGRRSQSAVYGTDATADDASESGLGRSCPCHEADYRPWRNFISLNEGKAPDH